MKNHHWITTLSILILAALACGGTGVATQPAEAPPPPLATDTPSVEDAPAPGEPAAVLDLDNPALYNQPAGVASYLTTLDYRFEAPGSVIGSVRLEGATQAEPYETTLEFDTEGRAVMGGGETFYFTQIGGIQYTVYEGFSCLTGEPGAQENPFEVMLDLGGMLTGEARLIGEETVNDFVTDVYEITKDNIDTSDPAGMGVETIDESRIYIAREGGFVLRLTIDGTGRVSVLSGDPSLLGDVYYELNYSHFGVPVDVQIPPGCPGGVAEAEYPVPQDAVKLTTIAGVTTFESQSLVDDVATFYKTEMPALGCGEAQESGSGQTLTLTFACPAGAITVLLSPIEPAGTSAVIHKVP